MQTTTPHRSGSTIGRVVTSFIEGAVSSLRIEGALDALTVREVRTTIDAVVARQPRHVTVDFERVTLLDSTGVGAIVSLFKRITAQGGSVVVVRAHDQPLAVLKLLKLDVVFGL
jgi:anti-sigma B factor antagonist